MSHGWTRTDRAGDALRTGEAMRAEAPRIETPGLC
jgi:hypothetical protein